MRCKTCHYRLWNLTERRCPECGTPFWPSEFEFVPNSVQFCCPHCRQAYYGTDAKGHLDPPTFTCVSCGRPVSMNEMVLLPTAGIEEEQTQTVKVPWLERGERGALRAWIATIGMALVSPQQLGRALPSNSSASPAWGFALLTALVANSVGGLSVMLLPLFMFSWMRLGAGMCAMPCGLAVILVLGTGVLLGLVALWGLVAHGLLRLTGSTAHSIGRTYEALCYGSGAHAITAIPFCGLYIGWIWWLISATLTLKEAQRVHGGRAALATLAPAVLCIGGVLRLSIWLMSWALTLAPRASTVSPSVMQETQVVLQAVLRYGERHDGQGPAHAAYLVSDGDVRGVALSSAGSLTTAALVPVAGTTLDKLAASSGSAPRLLARAAADALPPGTIAHRLGDYVFTYPGIDLHAPDPQLWLVIRSLNPPTNPRIIGNNLIAAGQADGTVVVFTAAELPAKLAEQNALRATHKLPPLPDPATVLHGNPATSAP